MPAPASALDAHPDRTATALKVAAALEVCYQRGGQMHMHAGPPLSCTPMCRIMSLCGGAGKGVSVSVWVLFGSSMQLLKQHATAWVWGAV